MKDVNRSQQRCTPGSHPLGPPFRAGINMGCILCRGNLTQQNPAGVVLFSRLRGGTFLRICELQKIQPLTTPVAAQRAPHTLRRRSSC